MGMITMFGFLFLIVLFGGYFAMTSPIALPYLKAKMSGGMLINLKTDTGAHKLIPTDKNYKNKTYGSFMPTAGTAYTLAGISFAEGFTNMSIFPTKEACEAAETLKEHGGTVYGTIEESIDNGLVNGLITPKDASALYEYSACVNPHYVNSRIEHQVAEVLASQRNDIGKAFTYALAFVMIMIGAGIAYQMVSSGSVDAVSDSVSNIQVPL